ncbi:MAG: hypothetical protein EAZ27_00605 [Cytophagales bacterium]|nr:MAG: hypothetical protein EAZ27_00605 [Cytophagales bacterium]
MGAKLKALKLQNNSDNITPFAGLNFISNDFDKSKLAKIIENELPNKSKLATYTLNNDINPICSFL